MTKPFLRRKDSREGGPRVFLQPLMGRPRYALMEKRSVSKSLQKNRLNKDKPIVSANLTKLEKATAISRGYFIFKLIDSI